MQFARFGDDRYGFVRGDDVYDITSLAERSIAAQPALRWGDPFVAALPAVRGALSAQGLGAPAARVSDVVLLSPVMRPSKVIAAPVNYDLHIAEAEADPAISLGKAVARIDEAGLFLKATSSLVGPGEGVAVASPIAAPTTSWNSRSSSARPSPTSTKKPRSASWPATRWAST